MKGENGLADCDIVGHLVRWGDGEGRFCWNGVDEERLESLCWIGLVVGIER